MKKSNYLNVDLNDKSNICNKIDKLLSRSDYFICMTVVGT